MIGCGLGYFYRVSPEIADKQRISPQSGVLLGRVRIIIAGGWGFNPQSFLEPYCKVRVSHPNAKWIIVQPPVIVLQFSHCYRYDSLQEASESIKINNFYRTLAGL
jgi:hypothetical protein